MYFWNAEKLAEDFREGRVDERERFKYYFAYTIFLAIPHSPLWLGGPSYDKASLILAALCLVITIIGILLCYKANSSGDNIDFIPRMICLTWPITIRLIVFFLLTYLLFVGFYYLLFYTAFLAMGGVMGSPLAKAATRPEFVATVFGVFFTISWYWMMYSYLTNIAHDKGNADPH